MGKMKAFYHEEISQQTEEEMGPQLPQVFILWCREEPDTERHIMGVYADETSAHLDRLFFLSGDLAAQYSGRFKYEVLPYEVQGGLV